MSANESRSAIQAYLDGVNSHNLSKLDDIFAEDVRWQSPAGKVSGRAQLRHYMERWFTAFPDLKLIESHKIENENQAAIECRLTGTQQGKFLSDFSDLRPTNKKIDVDLVNIIEVRNGKISELRVLYDSARLMDQLGVRSEKRAA